MSESKPIDPKIEAIAQGMFKSLQMITDGPQEAYEVLLCAFILFHIETRYEKNVEEFITAFTYDFTDGATTTLAHMNRSLQ